MPDTLKGLERVLHRASLDAELGAYGKHWMYETRARDTVIDSGAKNVNVIPLTLVAGSGVRSAAPECRETEPAVAASLFPRPNLFAALPRVPVVSLCSSPHPTPLPRLLPPSCPHAHDRPHGPVGLPLPHRTHTPRPRPTFAGYISPLSTPSPTSFLIPATPRHQPIFVGIDSEITRTRKRCGIPPRPARRAHRPRRRCFDHGHDERFPRIHGRQR
ncbi:hypothetical protein B0H11DRAFT_1951882 [Mycena galericulata]|nr:hypothetical protein B0H11DRAFT_1951882 [Mycena galericulata]